MAIRPILSTLARHRIAAGLIVVEVALSFAIVCNALHMIAQRAELLTADTGLAETELLNVDLRAVAPIQEAWSLSAEDLRRMRALPGVKGVASTNQVIYGHNVNNSGVSTEADNRGTRVVATSYQGDAHFIPVHGLKLVAGRNFNADEIRKPDDIFQNREAQLPSVIVSQTLAKALFPGQNAVGKQVWIYNNRPSTVVGVVEALPHPSPRRVDGDAGAFIAPIDNNFRGGTYVLRVEPGRQDAVLKEVATLVREVDARRSVGRALRLTEMRDRYYAEDRAMTWLLAGVCVALLAVTAFGIVGLVSFWVAQRTRMIGVRRALGATQKQIRQYFQLENLLLCGAGVVLGVLGAVGLSQGVLQPEGAPALPWAYLPVGALLMLLLGQLAVLAPARKASQLPAATAMRA